MIGRLLEFSGLAYIGSAAGLFAKLKTGVDGLDRLQIRGLVALFLPWIFWRELRAGPDRMVQIGRAFMSCLNNESKGNPRFYLGDQSASGGPSIGPGQIYRRTAKDLGLFKDPTPEVDGDPEERSAYAALAEREGFGINACLIAFADKLDQVKRAGNDAGYGDIWSAVRRYNGSGPHAEEYRAKAAAFHRQTWGSLP